MRKNAGEDLWSDTMNVRMGKCCVSHAFFYFLPLSGRSVLRALSGMRFCSGKTFLQELLGKNDGLHGE